MSAYQTESDDATMEWNVTIGIRKLLHLPTGTVHLHAHSQHLSILVAEKNSRLSKT